MSDALIWKAAVAEPARAFAAYLLGFHLDREIAANGITARDIIEDSLHDEDDESERNPATPRPEYVHQARPPTWSEIASYIDNLTLARLYGPAIALVSLTLMAIAVKQAVQGDPASFPIITGAAGSLPLLCAVRYIHFPGKLSPAARTAIALAATMIVGGAGLETSKQLAGLFLLSHASTAQLACLMIPAGMFELGGVLLFVYAKRETTGRYRAWAAPGWALVAAGCMATYFTTSELPNLLLVLGAGLAACLAYKKA